jgi:hypothetical protein
VIVAQAVVDAQTFNKQVYDWTVTYYSLDKAGRDKA